MWTIRPLPDGRWLVYCPADGAEAGAYAWRGDAVAAADRRNARPTAPGQLGEA